jgi:hypothetical protein
VEILSSRGSCTMDENLENFAFTYSNMIFKEVAL